jgi:CRP-like cAMP-binding protein
VIPARITHRDIAAMVGASREVVTRIFRSLEETGVVRVAGRRITLTVSRPRN